MAHTLPQQCFQRRGAQCSGPGLVQGPLNTVAYPLRLAHRSGFQNQIRGMSPPEQCVKAKAAQQPGLLAGLMEAMMANLQKANEIQPTPASLTVDSLIYQPPGADKPLLQGVGLHLPGGRMGLVYGRSGAGKTTLLQMVAGLTNPTSGSISVSLQRAGQPVTATTTSQLAAVVGIVFQFPERHFLGETIMDELTFGWPYDPWQRKAASMQLTSVLEAVDLDHISVKTPLSQLSDGYKRRVALAVQLARQPSLLLLDEPLAGLDWKSRADVAKVLGKLKKQCTVLAVSHDLRELVPLVDNAWKMSPGGLLNPSEWPPAEGSMLL